MRVARFALLLIPLALFPQGRAAAQSSSGGPEEQVLKTANLPTTGDGLLQFFRKRTTEPDKEKMTALIKQLGDKTPSKCDEAISELVSVGAAAIPLLRQAANDLDDPEAGARARRCLQLLEAQGAAISSAAAKLLAVHKPAGAAEALLAYLPYAEDDKVAEEINAALVSVAVRDGKPDPALIKALEDKVPIRRAVAAEVLCQIGGADRSAVRPLLKDAKPTVRLRVAMALTSAHDPEAVPVLIGLFSELPQAQTKQIEEYLIQLAGDWTMTVPQGSDDISRRLRREVWTAWWKSMDGAALVDEFKKRSVTDAEREKIQTLIKQLGDVSAPVRDKAFADLKTYGQKAIPLLRRAANSHEPAVSQPAQKCLQVMDKDALPALPTAAARLLALRKPEGAAEALLGYLPSCEDETMTSEVQAALIGVAVRDGKPDPALIKALEDKLAQRRIAAVEALCHGGAGEARKEVRKLLEDADLTVRLRAALALAGGTQDKEAVPVLISLLAELPVEQMGDAEEYLRMVAGDKAPNVQMAGADEAGRKKVRDAWAAWWKDNGEKVQMVKIDMQQRMLGYTLLVEQYSNVKRSGRVFEIDSAGRIRFDITGLSNPMDAQVLPGNRVLIAEQGAQRVTERNFKGEILWQKQVNQPVAVQRLSNGNTFIASNFQIIEVDRNGTSVFTHNRNNGDIIRAHKFPNGHIAYITWNGDYVRMDAAGKTLKTHRINDIPNWGGYADVLPNDHVLFCNQGNNTVVEYDADAKVVWQANLQFPQTAYRLPNGNTLISLPNQMKVVELDRGGKQVWEYKENVRPWRVKRR